MVSRSHLIERCSISLSLIVTGTHLSYLAIVYLLLLGVFAWRAFPKRSARAGWWLLAWSVPSGLFGAMIWFTTLMSAIPELRDNELLLVYLPNPYHPKVHRTNQSFVVINASK